MPEYNDWFPTSLYGSHAINVKSLGAIGDGLSNALSTLGFSTLADAQNGVGGNGIAYPSATSLDDTADWCGITEAIKHAFQHETSPGVWEWNGTEGFRNKPLYFPGGYYSVRKSIRLVSIQGAYIYGDSDVGTRINNEWSDTPGQPASEKACISTNGFSFARVENLNFSTAGGPTSVAFDSNCDGGTGAGGVATVNNNAVIFINCGFHSPSGIGLNIADPATPSLPDAVGMTGYMGSEMTFIRCNADTCAAGFVIQNWNALNYIFIQCGAVSCTTGLSILAGGMVSYINGSLAGNGLDIKVACSTCAIIATRTESKKFVWAGGPTSIINCVQNWTGNDGAFVQVEAPTVLMGCISDMGRIYGGGAATIDACSWGQATIQIIGITNASGIVRFTHVSHPNSEWFLDGDTVEVSNVASTGAGAASVNGIWTLHKINAVQVELVGSTYVADTYNLTNARFIPGETFAFRNPETGVPSEVKVSALPSRLMQKNEVKNYTLKWFDSGKMITNDGATGNVVHRLPPFMGAGFFPLVGARFMFTILAGHQITIEVDPSDPGDEFGEFPRMFRVGGYATAGTNISCSTIGASVELYCVESNIQTATVTHIGHRWLVKAEEGTWTIAGTPA